MYKEELTITDIQRIKAKLEYIQSELVSIDGVYQNLKSVNMFRKVCKNYEEVRTNIYSDMKTMEKLIDATLTIFKKMDDIEEIDKKYGVWEIPTEKQCGNCNSTIYPEDKYCRICGTRVGEGKYEPYFDIMQCIYGPMPVKRQHNCKGCGYEWTTCLMIDNEKYCPKCGFDTINEISEFIKKSTLLK